MQRTSYWQPKLTQGSFIGTKRNKSKVELDKEYVEHCIQLKKQKKFKLSKEKEKNKMLKRCQKCLGFKDAKSFYFCPVCQDAYHKYCLGAEYSHTTKGKNKDSMMCPRCKEEQKTLDKFIEKRSKKTNEEESSVVNLETISSSGVEEKNNNEKNSCYKCKKKLSEKSEKICEKCHHCFHPQCFRKEDSKIICSECEKAIASKMKKTRIDDYFKTKKLPALDLEKEKLLVNKIKNMTDFGLFNKISEKLQVTNDSEGLIIKKSEGRLRLPKELKEDQRKIMRESLFRALEVKKISFNDDLVYIDDECPKEMNNAKIEACFKGLSEYNRGIYDTFKQRTRKGEYGPIEVADDPVQKFIVKAIDNIPINTLICEYTGEVTLLRKKMFDKKNDSIMELITSPNSDLSLVIAPEKYGNLARFLSGVNNHDPILKKKQNVYSLKVSIDGSMHILLIAGRNIKKGEVLYYDYNAGINHEGYPTEKFV